MIKDKLLKINYRFLIIFLIVIFKYLKMQMYLSNSIINGIFAIIIGVICIIIVRRKVLKNFNKNWLIIGSLIALIQIVFLHEVDILLLICIAIIFSEDKNGIKNIIKYFLISLLIVFFSTILLYQLGYLQYDTISRLTESGARIQRNSCGFRHPNEMYVYFFFIVLALYYVMKNKKLYTIILIISSYIIYNVTLSRTGLICSIILIILIWFYNNKIKLNKYVFLIGTLITFFMAFSFDNGNSELNELLSGRPSIYNFYINNGDYIYNIVGNNLLKGITLDNAFLNIILGSGWIFYIFYFILFYISGKFIENDRKLTIIFIVTVIYGCVETHVLNIGLNFMLLIQMYTVLTRNNELKGWKKNEKN